MNFELLVKILQGKKRKQKGEQVYSEIKINSINHHDVELKPHEWIK